MKTGLYPLDTSPTTFDFAVWAVIARTMGCEHVRFVISHGMDERKYSADIGWRRFGNILIPLCKLAGLTYSVGGECAGHTFNYFYGHVDQMYRKNGQIERLKPAEPVRKSDYITITLRQSFRNKFRNSNTAAWAKFASTVQCDGVTVITLDECEDEPLSVLKRMALYAGARMNIGVENGPMVLCHLSDAPYITMNMCPPEYPGERHSKRMVGMLQDSGFKYGSQLSFAAPNQRLVWKPDTFDNIIEAYEYVTLQKAAA